MGRRAAARLLVGECLVGAMPIAASGRLSATHGHPNAQASDEQLAMRCCQGLRDPPAKNTGRERVGA